MPNSGEQMKYFDELEKKVEEAYRVAEKARALCLDPEPKPEIPRAEDLAARVEKLVGPKGVAPTIRKLEKELPREEVALKIAEMIVDGHFGRLDEARAAEQAVRTALAIITEGIAAAAPIEGITQVKIKKNFDGSRYLALYFAGPIRSAGGTAAALAVLTGDFVRRKLYLDAYKPTDEEVERFVEEVEMYSSEVTHLQYTPPADDVRKAVRNIPVEINGEPTEQVTVSGYRNLDRIETNRIRGGAVLALAEGVLQKAPKILKYVKKLGIEGWEWLHELSHRPAEEEEEARPLSGSDRYLADIIAGRAVFGHPAREGGFRLRYGRARNTGLAAVGIHPATMKILEDHLAIGTQLKIERPGKAAAVAPVDTIEGPIVKLADGSVVQVDSVALAEEIRSKVSEILFLGDILIGFGEFLENNHPLMPAGYCEEWWAQEVKKALKEKGKSLPRRELEKYTDAKLRPPARVAVELSQKLGVPLHPAYTYHFNDVSLEEIREVGEWLAEGEPEFDEGALKRLRLKISPTQKRVLEILGVPHAVEDGHVVIEEPALPLCTCLGLIQEGRLTSERLRETIRTHPTDDTMEIIQILAGFPVRVKAPTRIGCRMGRPEKANPRKMSPPPHVLFPIGLRGGHARSIPKAAEKGVVYVEVVRCQCPECGTITFRRKCPKCGGRTEFTRICSNCGRTSKTETCVACGARTVYYDRREIEIRSLLDEALKKLREQLPKEIKGVRGMTSDHKIPEPLEKGILRAKHGVYVFKDGTIRFDATNLPLTHFRPREVGTSVERLRELGYERDVDGNPLEREDQVLELKVQDVVLSKPCAEYLLRAARFVDDLLQKFYGLPPYYNATQLEDLVGQLIIGLAPHTSAGVVGRIIGFTEANVGYAHPYFHAAKRRDADGDEDAVMLLMDALLNFSRHFLPSSRGGTMDAPLVLNARIDPREIDREAHNVDVSPAYPLEFYEATLRFADPSEMASKVETVKRRLGTRAQYEGLRFTHDTSDIAAGPKACRYKTLATMEEKVDAQLSLGRKIRAVDERDVAERLIEHHFIPDLRGNIRAFAKQKFRCTSCNAKYRRVPLSGKCRCGGELILTVTRGGVEKYLQVAMRVADEFGVKNYTRQRLSLVEREIKSIFESDDRRQLSIADFI